MAPVAEPAEDSALQGLLLRARAALQALSDGKVRTASGLDSVKELQGRLEAFSGQCELQGFGVDLRQVQESIVEHAAMYANCDEVLGGMLQLTFCLDHVRSWLEQRDLAVQDALSQMDTLQRNYEDCSFYVTELGMEVRNCAKHASTLELELALRGRGGGEVRAPSNPGASPLSSARGGRSPSAGFMRISQTGPGISVDLEALEAESDQTAWLEELRRENVSLRNRLAETAAETAAVRSAAQRSAEAAQNAAEQTAVAAAQVAASCSPAVRLPQELRTDASALEILEKLEPALASLPVGLVPGMSELQEEACETYGRLRQLLIVAAAGEPVAGVADEMPPRTPRVPMSWEPVPQPMLPMSAPGVGGFAPIPTPLYTRSSTSNGTSEEPLDTWRATIVSDPVRGIGPYGGTFGNGAPFPVHEHFGSAGWANRLS